MRPPDSELELEILENSELHRSGELQILSWRVVAAAFAAGAAASVLYLVIAVLLGIL